MLPFLMMLSDLREILMLESNQLESSTRDPPMPRSRSRSKSRSKSRSESKSGFSHLQEGWLASNLHEEERARYNPHTEGKKPQFYQKKSNHSAGCESVRRSLQQFTELNVNAIEHISNIMMYSISLDSVQLSMNSVFNNSNSTINQFWNQYFSVFNISDYKCDNIELSVLGKGLKFCPTPPKYCHGQMKESIDKFFRSCSLKLFLILVP